MALKRVWIASPNYSSRSGSGVRLVVVHTAEGASGFRNLGSFFSSASAQVSSHTGIDDERGSIGEYVKRENKAWTQASYNSQAVATELCAAPVASSYPCGANWDAAEWNRHPDMLANVADWIAEECAAYGIPVKKLSSGEAQGSGRGVCGHADLGAGGGGHWDPGPNFPWDKVMNMAQGGSPEPAPEPQPDEGAEPFVVVKNDGRLVAFTQKESGEVLHAYQESVNGGWAGSEPGKAAKWYSLGNPGK